MAEVQRRRGPKPASERLRRLLVMLPWLMQRGEVSVAEMAAHFGVSESELVGDLQLASMCGVGPYIDEMIDLYIEDDGTIVPGTPRFFQRPLRLLRHEAFALLAAAETASVLPAGDDALHRALRKVRERLGGAVEVAGSAPQFTDTVQEAVRTGERLEIEYWTPSRDEVTSRTIIPRLVFSDHGDYFVRADDERSGELREFRIDRIQDVRRTGEFVPLREVPAWDGQWFADSDVPAATVRLAPEARWVVERYPVRSVRELDDGSCEAVLPVASERWLARLLLRLGTRGEVVAPERFRALGQDTARAVLARYAVGD
jgi:proteasome accessory factor C